MVASFKERNMQTTVAGEAPQPVQQRERIAILDVLRGFALFGILTVNMYLFSRPLQELYQGVGAAERPGHDQVADWLVAFFATGKFYTLFSFLFGLGFTIFIARARAKGQRAAPLFARRLLVLLGFGLVHGFFIWVGDILTFYALVGFVLLLFAWVKRPRTLLIWAFAIWLLSVVGMTAGVGLMAVAAAVPEARTEIDASLAAQAPLAAAEAERAREVYANGNFLEITAQRAQELLLMWGFGLFTVPSILMMFLLGAYFGRREIFRDVDAHLPLFRRMLIWGLVIGLPANAIYATLFGSAVASTDGLLASMGATLAGIVGHPALSLAYMSGIVLLTRREAWARRLGVLAPVGQMALSNYLLQSIVCTLIFYGYGLGLFGQVGTVAGLALAAVIFALQIPLSHWWMARFRYGPAEWLWRTLTYGKAQPLRRSSAAAAPGALEPQG
jgi:uncharacterized protein